MQTLCAPESFGVWAHAFSALPPQEVEPFISDAIRPSYLQASWQQSITGIVAALGLPRVPPMPDEVWAAKVMSVPVMSTISDAGLKASARSQHRFGQWRRALVLPTRTDLVKVLVERHKRIAVKGSRAPVTPVVTASAPKPAPSRPIPPVAPPPPAPPPVETVPT